MPMRNAIPNACIDSDQGSEGIDTCPCRKGHEGTDIGVTFRASIVSVWSRPDDQERARRQRRQEATMAEPDGNGISARLWRLPGQLLLALIKRRRSW